MVESTHGDSAIQRILDTSMSFDPKTLTTAILIDIQNLLDEYRDSKHIPPQALTQMHERATQATFDQDAKIQRRNLEQLRSQFGSAVLQSVEADPGSPDMDTVAAPLLALELLLEKGDADLAQAAYVLYHATYSPSFTLSIKKGPITYPPLPNVTNLKKLRDTFLTQGTELEVLAQDNPFNTVTGIDTGITEPEEEQPLLDALLKQQGLFSTHKALTVVEDFILKRGHADAQEEILAARRMRTVAMRHEDITELTSYRPETLASLEQERHDLLKECQRLIVWLMKADKPNYGLIASIISTHRTIESVDRTIQSFKEGVQEEVIDSLSSEQLELLTNLTRVKELSESLDEMRIRFHEIRQSHDISKVSGLRNDLDDLTFNYSKELAENTPPASPQVEKPKDDTSPPRPKMTGMQRIEQSIRLLEQVLLTLESKTIDQTDNAFNTL